MASSIILGVKIAKGPLKRHKLVNYDLHDKVIALKQEAVKATGLAVENIEIIYHGKILADDATLIEHGVKPGEMIHVLKKEEHKQTASPDTVNEMTIEQLIAAIRIFGPVPTSPAWTQALQIASDPVLMEEILTAVPELENDPVAFSILHEPELIAHLKNNVLARRLNTEKPVLIAGVKKLVHMVNRMVSSKKTTGLQTTTSPSGYAYSLEVLSEDEDEDDEDGEEYSRMMEASSGITNQQLAAALRSATRVSAANRSGSGARDATRDILQFLRFLPGNSNSTSPQGPSRAQSGNASSRSIITSDMFSNALSQAMTSVVTPNPSLLRLPLGNSNALSNILMPNSITPQPSETPMSVDPPQGDGSYDTQLQTMREMGLVNERLNIRALLLSDGDVMAAVNLVFSGAIED